MLSRASVKKSMVYTVDLTKIEGELFRVLDVVL